MVRNIIKTVVLCALTCVSVTHSFDTSTEIHQERGIKKKKNALRRFEDFLENSGQEAAQGAEYALELLKKETQYLSVFSGSWTCAACQDAMEPVEAFITNLTLRYTIEYLLIEYCMLFKVFGGEESFCKGIMRNMGDVLMPSLARGIFSKGRICNEFLHLCQTQKIEELDADAWVKNKLSSKPSYLNNNHFIDGLYTIIKADSKDREQNGL